MAAHEEQPEGPPPVATAKARRSVEDRHRVYQGRGWSRDCSSAAVICGSTTVTSRPTTTTIANPSITDGIDQDRGDLVPTGAPALPGSRRCARAPGLEGTAFLTRPDHADVQLVELAPVADMASRHASEPSFTRSRTRAEGRSSASCVLDLVHQGAPGPSTSGMPAADQGREPVGSSRAQLQGRECAGGIWHVESSMLKREAPSSPGGAAAAGRSPRRTRRSRSGRSPSWRIRAAGDARRLSAVDVRRFVFFPAAVDALVRVDGHSFSPRRTGGPDSSLSDLGDDAFFFGGAQHLGHRGHAAATPCAPRRHAGSAHALASCAFWRIVFESMLLRHQVWRMSSSTTITS